MPLLPISRALKEALPESISELYSRDVETLSDADIDRIIEEQRAHRTRMEATESLPKRIAKAPDESKGLGRGRAPAPDLNVKGLVL